MPLPSPIGTALAPLTLRGFGPWDCITILDVTLLLKGQPRYAKELKHDKKGGGGSDYETTTGKGYKSAPIDISVQLWIDTNGQNWLQTYADLVPRILAKEIAKRYAVVCYTPALTDIFGISSIIVTSCSTPQYEGKQMWSADIKALDARNVGTGTGKKSATKKMVRADQLTAKTVVNREVIAPPGSPNQSGPQAAQQLQSRVNTPATRSTTP